MATTAEPTEHEELVVLPGVLPGTAADYAWAADSPDLRPDGFIGPETMARIVNDLRRRIAVGQRQLSALDTDDGDNYHQLCVTRDLLGHLRRVLAAWEDMLQGSRRTRVASRTTRWREPAPRPRRRLDRRLSSGRPRARAVARASSRGGDSGDPDLGDEPPGHRLPLHEEVVV